VRVRHGIAAGPGGYRAMREVDGRRFWLGPWRVREADAETDLTTAKQALLDALAAAGGGAVDRPNPDIGIWLPTRGAG
jgi:hypothetical protein